MSIRVQHIRGTTAEIESVTPLAGELGYDTQRREPHLGDGATAGGVRLAKKNIVEIVSPAQITADQNNYSPTNLRHAGVLLINSDAARNVTGMVPLTDTDSADGRTIQLYNNGAFNITLKDQSGSSTAANRFDLNSADVVLLPKTTITLRYDNSSSRWLIVGSNVGASVASLGVIARTIAGSALGFSMVNGTLVESHAGSAATFAIKTLAGADPTASDPVLVLIRNATLATGDYTMMAITAATSLVVSSGSSLGTSNSAAFKLWLVGFNDAGTFRLGVINALDGVNALPMLTPDQLASSTAEGGAGNADSALVFYTGTAVASKPYAVLGFADYPSGLAAAGTWSASPTTLQLYHAAVPLPGRNFSAQIRNSGGITLINGRIVPSVGGSALTVAIKTLAGNDPSASDPVYVLFRNATFASGDFTIRTITAATSLVVSSGSTLGTANATAFRIWLVGFDDAGTFRLGVMNCLVGLSIYPLGRITLLGSLAEGGAGAADSAHTIYSGVAVSAKAYAVLGYMSWESGLATAGTWSAAPDFVQLFGHGVPLPGAELQRTRLDTGAVASGTTVIPHDDTVPQSTEGDQYMALGIQPSSAANLINVKARAILSSSVVTFIEGALFRDAGASAKAATAHFGGNATGEVAIEIDFTELAGSTSSSTYKFRGGGGAAGTTTFNGISAGRIFGGAMNSLMEARELMV